MTQFDASDVAILELVAEDGTAFRTLSDAVGATEAQSSVRGLWRRGLVGIARVREMDAPPDRPVSTLTPDVRSTSRLVEEVVSGDDAEAAIDDGRNWRRLEAVPVGVWYEVTPTIKTEEAYRAAWLEHNPVDRA
jgi:hypothetical protein